MNELQKTLDAFASGDVWLHATPTAHLNTTFLLNCAAYWSRRGRVITVISSEMDPNALHSKTPEDKDECNIVYRDRNDWTALLEGTLYVPKHHSHVIIVDQVARFPDMGSVDSASYYMSFRDKFAQLRYRVLDRPHTALMVGMTLSRLAANSSKHAVQEAKQKDRYPIGRTTIFTTGYHDRPSHEQANPPLQLTAINAPQDPFEIKLATDLKRHWIDLTAEA